MRTASSSLTDLVASKDLPAKSIDAKIEAMALVPMREAVLISEGMPPRLRFPNSRQRADSYLVARLYTDAVFNQDIRAIQTIINRIDGGLPKDTELDGYRTLFGDCIAEVLEMDDPERIKVFPEDSVMMALCKSLYMMATENIYVDPKTKMPKRPSTEKKNERDTALRMILERVGGRKTKIEENAETAKVGLADWIADALPESKQE